MVPLVYSSVVFCMVFFFLMKTPPRRSVYPPPSGRHAMRCLYVIGRDGWVWDMSNTQWLEMDSSHRVGECSVSVVCPLAGVYSRRRLSEINVDVVVIVVDDDDDGLS